MEGLAAQSDLETWQPTVRGKFALVGALIVGALVAAAYSFFAHKGTGNPEEVTKVLVVTRGAAHGESDLLGDVGFEAAEGSLAAWVEKAHKEVPDLDVDGVPAVMALADRFGWGFVLFEDPADVDLSGIDVEALPAFSDDVQWAAVSAGDLGFPSRVTTHPPPSKVLHDPSIAMLQALFAQEPLAGLLDPQELAADELAIARRLATAVERLGNVPAAEHLVDRILAELRAELADQERGAATPALVGEPLESGSAVALRDGAVLTNTRGFELVTDDARVAELELDQTQELRFGLPGADPAGRAPCPTLGGGEFAVSDLRDVNFSPDGAVALLDTRAAGEHLWALTITSPPSCLWTHVGKVPAPRLGVHGLPQPWRTGKVARAGWRDEMGFVSVVDVRTTAAQELGSVPGVGFGEVVWLRDEVLAAVAQPIAGGPPWLALMSTRVPAAVLRLSAETVPGSEGVSRVLALPGRDAIVVASVFGERMYRVGLPRPLDELFADPPAAGPPVRSTAGVTVTELDPAAFDTELIARGHRTQWVATPAGRHVVFVSADARLDPHAPDDGEIVMVDVDSGHETVLTRNGLKDGDPQVTADGAWVLFSTQVRVPKTEWFVTVPRILGLPLL